MKAERVKLADLSAEDRKQILAGKASKRASKRKDPRQRPDAASKMRNIKTTVDDIKFDSKLEAHRYSELKLREKAGEISELRLQHEYELQVNGMKICSYFADFVYVDKDGNEIVEDAKGTGRLTDVYRLKKKLMKAVHNIDIQEVYTARE